MELISGKEALIALANGEEVELRGGAHYDWKSASNCVVEHFLQESFEFRLKPRTISINGIEVPASAEDKDCHHQGVWILNSLEPKEYGCVVLDITDELPRYWWRTEEEIRQVVDALRKVFKEPQQ